MACSGAIVVVAEPVTTPVLCRLHAVDIPLARSSHSVPTLRGGGLPIAVGLLTAVAITRSGASAAFAAAVGCFGVLGFVDDLRRLPPLRRLALQATEGAVAAGLLALPMHMAAVAAMLAVAAAAWITASINVFNFMDGVNGISAVHARSRAWPPRTTRSGGSAGAIGDLAADPQRRAAMGLADRRHVERHYDRVALTREYRKILDAPGGRR